MFDIDRFPLIMYVQRFGETSICFCIASIDLILDALQFVSLPTQEVSVPSFREMDVFLHSPRQPRFDDVGRRAVDDAGFQLRDDDAVQRSMVPRTVEQPDLIPPVPPGAGDPLDQGGFAAARAAFEDVDSVEVLQG